MEEAYCVLRVWERVADDFDSIWNVSHYVGPVNGNHIVRPFNCDSQYYNYKGNLLLRYHMMNIL